MKTASLTGPAGRGALLLVYLGFGVVAAAVGSEPDRRPVPHWNEFRGPEGNGHADSARLPLTWNEASKNIRWKTEIHGKGWSSPVVWGDQIWLTTAPADGKKLWAL